MSEKPAAPTAPRAPRWGLFARIFATFFATSVITVLLVATAAWLGARATSNEWVNVAIEGFDEHNDAIVGALPDPTRALASVGPIDRDLSTVTSLYDAHGARVLGPGPDRLPRRVGRRERQLARGRPVVLRPEGERPALLYPLTDEHGAVVGTLYTVEATRLRQRLLLGLTPALLLAFGLGAWRLARSLARRIEVLERGVERIAGGELGHRVPTPPKLVDELDQLAVAVNEMASRLDRLVGGQRTLLANVSHELRTPLARIKVVLEILRERVDHLRELTPPDERVSLDRIDRSVHDLDEDLAEMEALVGDLLASGRLDLRAGEGLRAALDPVDLGALLHRIGGRFGATVTAPDGLVLAGEEFLVERLVSNLLSNARRACPDGAVTIRATATDDAIELVVEDEGPGIDPSKRELIFEPFARLDDARSRDRGGAGLGLHLCRQVCTAHGGTIEATDRADGRAGAALRVRLPRRAA